MRVLIALLLLASGYALAKDFTITDQDQANIQGLCDAAALSPSLTRQVRASVAAWCVEWQKRVEEAAKPEAAEKK